MIRTISVITKNMRRFKTKNLQEQKTAGRKPVEFIDLPNGKYLGDGGGSEYGIKDLNGTETGYIVKVDIGVRGLPEGRLTEGIIQNDPVEIIDGVPYSETWGEGGQYFYEEMGYKPGQTETIINNVAKEGVKLNNMLIQSEDYPLTYGVKSKITCNYKGKSYVWDITGIHEFSSTIKGTLQCHFNNFQLDDSTTAMQYLQLDDADPNGKFVGLLYDRTTYYIVYDSMSGPKFKTVNP